MDVDSTALQMAKNRLQPSGDQTITRQVNFRGLQGVLDELGWREVDGMLFDLGVSSLQLDDPTRGFSFQSDGPLDMRLDPRGNQTALSVLQTIQEKELIDRLTQFGEGRNARRVSRYLLSDVAQGRIQTTRDLASFCERVIGRRGKGHPATRLFLALRTLVNRELDVLGDLLGVAPRYLAVGGRLLIISFHSLEDKMVKERFRSLAQDGIDEKRFVVVTKKPVGPSEEEMAPNPRSRSAKLRAIERVT